MARPLSITNNNSLTLITSEKKFGTASANFDVSETPAKYLTIPNSGEFDFGTDNWTIEWWYYSISGELTPAFVSTTNWVIKASKLGVLTGDSRLIFENNPSGAGNDFTYTTGDTNITANTWHHYAVVRNGNTLDWYLDGVKIGAGYNVTGVSINAGSDLNVGIDYAVNLTSGLDYYMDEFRISNIARYTGNFTAPTAAHIDDANTLVLLHFDGTNGSTSIVDSVLQLGSAQLTSSFSLSATANPSPSMVFIRDDYPLTWDDTDTWERIGGIQDSWWPGYRYPLVSFDLTANTLRVKFGDSSLSATATVTAKGGFRQDGVSSLSAESNLQSGSDLYRNAAADLTAFVAQISTGERLPQGSASLSVTATLTSGSDLYKNAQSDLTAEFDLVSAGRNLKLAQIDIDDFATMSVAAQVELNAQANLSGEFTLTPRGGFLITIPEPYDYTWDTIPGDTWDSYFKDLWEPQGWFAFSTAELTAESSTGLEGEADLSSSTDLSAQADITRTVSATLAVTATVTAKGNYLQIGSADLEAFVAQVTVGEKILAGSSNLESLFTISADSEILRNAESNLSAVATLDARAGIELNASSSLEAFVAQVTAGQRLPQGSASLTVNTELTAVADLLFAVEVNLSAETDITTNAEILRGGRSNLIAFAAELVAGQRLPGGSADLTVVAGLTAKVGVILSTAQSDLEGFFAQVTVGRQSNVRGDASLASSFTAIFEGDLQLLESDFEIPVLSETRQYMVKSEIRDFSVLVDSRQHTVKSETNDFLVLPETRTLEIEV